MNNLLARYKITLLKKQHNRANFDYGVEALNRYLQEQAGQDSRRYAATVFVLEEQKTGIVFGYYTLSMGSVNLEHLPLRLQGKMPRYPTIPAVRLGRLAIHVEGKGQGLGRHLLMDAMARALRSEVAWAAFLVDAKDEGARQFYLKFGFLSLADDPLHLFIPHRTLKSLFG